MVKIHKAVQKSCPQLSGQISLCGYLEAIVGRYYLYGTGISDIETLYYDPDAGLYDPIQETKKNVAAYFFMDEHLAFVTGDKLLQLAKDTEGYDVTLIEVESFDAEILNKEELSFLNGCLKKIVWLDDDFMNDDSIEFDYKAFDVIDSGVKYLNPKHFSLHQLVSAYRTVEDLLR